MRLGEEAAKRNFEKAALPHSQSPPLLLYPSQSLPFFGAAAPFAVAPQLDKVIANLELMPLRLNIGKKDRMGERQQALAKRLRSVGLFGD